MKEAYATYEGTSESDLPMEERHDVTGADNSDYDPSSDGQNRLISAKYAGLGLVLVLGATLTYLELFNRFAP